MTNPTDDGRVSSPGASITFSGYHIQPNTLVQVRAWDFTANQMTNIGSAVPSSTTALNYADAPLYGWSMSRTLDTRFWRPGPSIGLCAVVDATTVMNGQTRNLLTLESDWLNCFGQNPTLLGFAGHCASNNSPVAKLYTQNWATVLVTPGRLALAAAIASGQISIMLDNFTATAGEFCSNDMPEGCPPGGGSDPETYKFYKPNGASFRQNADTLSFSISPSLSDPMTIYIDDMSSSALDFRVENSRFVIGIDFESAGPEIRMNCIRNAICAFVDGKTIEFASPRAEIRFQLSVQNGKVAYSDVVATFTSGTPGDDAAAASTNIGDAMTQKLRDEAAIRDKVGVALDAIVRGAAGLDSSPIEAVTVAGEALQVQPGCPMD